MREILFRGKDAYTGEWVHGFLVDFGNGDCGIISGFTSSDYSFIRVIPETVGQDTGFTDMNGVKIFEGDIVREHVNDYTPIYQNGIYMAYNVDKINDPYVSTQFNVIWRNGCEVIGYIHYSPELLEVQNEKP